jgi:hypothetical protein
VCGGSIAVLRIGPAGGSGKPGRKGAQVIQVDKLR